MALTIELPPLRNQIDFHLKRWEELSHDEAVASLNGRVETDRNGYVVMSPYAAGWHGAFEMKIGILMDRFLGGHPVTECPILTSDGVKLADVGWYSAERFQEVREFSAFPKAPEICVEVLSPSNTQSEMAEKRMLYFHSGCLEFWTCNREGEIRFYDSSSGSAVKKSELCPDFPSLVEIG